VASVHGSAAALGLPSSNHWLRIAIFERLTVAAVQLEPIVGTLVAEQSRFGVMGASRITLKVDTHLIASTASLSLRLLQQLTPSATQKRSHKGRRRRRGRRARSSSQLSNGGR